LPNKYGAGEPSVTFFEGLFYLLLTDTTGLDSNQGSVSQHGKNQGATQPGNGAGVYVLRSPDPAFQSNVEELVAPASFAPVTPSNHTTYSLAWRTGLDWLFVEELDRLAVAAAVVCAAIPPQQCSWTKAQRVFLPNRTGLQAVFNPSTLGNSGWDVAGPFVDLLGHWDQGPGLVRTLNGHALPGPSGIIPIDVLRPVGPNPNDSFTWDLAWQGGDIAVSGLGTGCWTDNDLDGMANQ
jgi:hypothetical protein